MMVFEMPAPLARMRLLAAMACLAVLLTMAVPSPASRAAGDVAGRSGDKVEAKTANWMPLVGRIRLGRTWGHRGGHDFPSVDLEVLPGGSSRVFAGGPGTVIATESGCPDTTPGGKHAECNGGQGNLVDIVHSDGLRSRYLHLRFRSVTVEPGDYVCRGCPIGRVGWSGTVLPRGPGGAHLHYEELLGSRIVDPGSMLAKRPGGRVSYPKSGLTWRQVGGEGVVMRNNGFPRPGPAPTASCLGWAATLVGTSGSDDLRGTIGPDIIAGEAGNDTIRGFDGEDRLCGGPGDDTLIGGANHDIIDGGDGTDTCFVGEDDSNKTAGEETLVSCERPLYVLTVEVRCCLRFVTSEPGGISCPPDCTESYPPGSVIILTLSTGGSPYWQGCDPEEGADEGQRCTVTMNADRHVSV